MSTALKEFTERLEEDWLPAFCDATVEGLLPEGFNRAKLQKVTEHDARWFLRAIDRALVEARGGYFQLREGGTRERMFGHGAKGVTPRSITFAPESVIAIGAVARLSEEFGWPLARISLQSRHPWPFDLVCRGENESYRVACEIKPAFRPLDEMLDEMHRFVRCPPLISEPAVSKARNAYRKVVGLRKERPLYFWALGPGGYEKALVVRPRDDELGVSIAEADISALAFAT